MTVFLKIAAVLLLVAGNAFFVAAEYALVTARRTGLVELAREGNRRARIALRIIDDPSLHRHGAARDHRVLHRPRCDRRAARRALPRPCAGADRLLHPRLRRRDIPARHARRARAQGARAHEERNPRSLERAPPRGVYIVTYPLVWILQRSANPFTSMFGSSRACRSRDRGRGGDTDDGRGGRGHGRHPRGRRGDALQGLRLRGQGGARGHGPAARGGRDLHRPASAGVSRGGHRLPVHPLSGLPRLARRRARLLHVRDLFRRSTTRHR